MSDSGWAELMTAALAGDAIAYRKLLGELIPWLRRFYGRRLPAEMIDDAVQDTLVAIHEKRHTYDPARPFGPWLTTIARYKWIDRVRVMYRWRTTLLDEALHSHDDEDGVVSAIAIDQLLATLKPPQAEAIRLVKLQGLSVKEASARLGQSSSLIKVNIHRGLAKLMDAVHSAAG
jgi:RNA polymerase sigma factor (sigma-70 family)